MSSNIPGAAISDNATDSINEPVIRVRNVSKCYHVYERPIHRLLQGAFGRSRKLFREFWALRNASFEVRRGETLGIVGRNGSGKSTLLQLIVGTLAPTDGSVEVKGRVAALLELGSGFNPDFTGKENVYLNASILGLSRAEIDARYATIVEFADIGDFIDQPVSSYSSGMVMRLAFSVMTHVDADILIIDEALAVGDAFFTQKCMRYLREFKQRGTLLFVSHDSSAVTGLCDRAIWLDRGEQLASGSAREVVDAYLEAFMADRQQGRVRKRSSEIVARAAHVPRKDFRREKIDRSTLRNDISVLPFHPGVESFGELKARVVDVVMLDEREQALAWIVGGESVILELVIEVDEAIERAIVGFYLKDRLGQLLFGDNTYLNTLEEGFSLRQGERFRARFYFDMPRLQAGDYFITAGVADGTQEEHVIQNWMHEALTFKSHGTSVPAGIIGVPMHNITLERY